MRKAVLVLASLVLGFGFGWLAARQRYEPPPQPDTRTALQRKLFRPGVTERTVFPVEPAGRNVGYRIKTDCAGAIYVAFWDNTNEDEQEWVADSQGRVLEYGKSSFGGAFPHKDILSDGAVGRVEYRERPSGIAKVDWNVTIWPRLATVDGLDKSDLQYSFDKLIEFLAQSRDST